MKVRLLTPSDAESYWALRIEGLKNYPEAFATSYEEAINKENPIEQVANNLKTKGNFTFGAFDEYEELIGVVTLIQEQHKKLQHRANIFAMYVTSKKSGLGVGKTLLTEAINKAKEIDDVEKINLTVVTSNQKAKNLYANLGFKVFGFEEKALKVNGVYYDEEHMVLCLEK
ncbi:GNAT family protein [Peribacillus sp. SIMBA_075]|uniref:GNAT family N-acetyltransferase n=1 Tax=Peribacillus TaxID=2675229 RepID=UPI002952B6B8|nr:MULTISPECIES: GNAT family protein [Peribacillus]MDV7765784.1 GNAT family N-acetyltransferase [Peribacillus sp. CSMR9]MDW7614342.1 GNAT family protein [Peribacillus simplex]